MLRIRLIHWNAEEARERGRLLEEAGYAVDWHVVKEQGDFTVLGQDPPDAVVIDLSRLPSHGRRIGVALRQQKRTRAVPLVFVEGDPDPVERVRESLPDATYATWSTIRSAVKRALAWRPTDPVVPPNVPPDSPGSTRKEGGG